MTKTEFINSIKENAEKISNQYGINLGMILAQACLESNFGTSELALKAKNLFGIKLNGSNCEYYSIKTKEYINGKYVTIVAKFRKYTSWKKSILDYANYLKYRTINGIFIYKTVFNYKNDYKKSCNEIWKCGYATDPNYPQKLINLIETYNLNGGINMSYKIYLSASTQENNKGVGSYGTEEKQMFILRDLTEQLIKSGNEGSKFTIEKNSNKSSSLANIVNESNNFGSDTHWAFHSNAGGGAGARGCEVYYSYLNTNGKGKKLATCWYDEISPITPTSDRGVKKDNSIYSNGFYELRKTNAIAGLCEFIFHDNLSDVNFFLANISKFALGTTKAIYKYYGYTYQEEKEYTGILLEAFNKKWFSGKDYELTTNVDFNKLCWILKQFDENYLSNKYQKK